jgi:hypothetical protein
MTRSGSEPGPPQWEDSDYQLELWRGLTLPEATLFSEYILPNTQSQLEMNF